ncbi:MAG TPA: 16S rRNA (guanine(527)-N(7))-methyltransferase RsmG [Paracoccaceae bacterium]|nr:16S rRNA (guanine(527)-N(7))-methyltransferase RsmG [Paracoccaceae bacterium]
METAEAFAGAFDVSRETLARLRLYEELLGKWSRSINLVSAASLKAVGHRHFADSAQLLALAPGAARSWIDLGSGAGFPGLVVAILAAEQRPALALTLVEADARKVAFLRELSRLVQVPVRIEACRAEALPARPHDVVSARALAPLPRLLELAAPFLAGGGVALLPKGAGWRSELTEAQAAWHIAVRAVPSLTDPAAQILCITEVQRAK